MLFLVVTARGLSALQLADRLGLAGDVVTAAVDGLVAWRFLVQTPDGFIFQPDPGHALGDDALDRPLRVERREQLLAVSQPDGLGKSAAYSS